jgi:hypothetical protein
MLIILQFTSKLQQVNEKGNDFLMRLSISAKMVVVVAVVVLLGAFADSILVEPEENCCLMVHLVSAAAAGNPFNAPSPKEELELGEEKD